TFNAVADASGFSASQFHKFWREAFLETAQVGVSAAQVISASFAALANIERNTNLALAITNPSLAGILGSNMPSAQKVGQDALNAFKKQFSATGAFFHNTLPGAINAVRDSRLRDQANELIGDRTPKKPHEAHKEAISAQERAYREALKAAQDYQLQLQRETDTVGADVIATKRMEAATASAAARKAATVAPTKAEADALRGLANQIMATEAAWETVFKNDQIKQFVKNTVEPLEFENSLFGKSADVQRMLRAERELTGGSIARGTAEWTRYTSAVQQAIANDHIKAQQDEMLRWADQLSGSIADVITGTESLGAAFKNVAHSIVNDIIQMTVRMLIFRAISGIFGGSKGVNTPFGGTIPNLAPNLNVSGRANGGSVSAGTLYQVNERGGPEFFRPNVSGSVIPLGKQAANNNAPIELIIHSAPSPDAWAQIDQISATRAGQAIKVSVDHTNNTLRSISRPKLVGR
ncbi:MAG: hypothetical protein JO335_00940, partial [Sphingomonas sp.]|nr:hypothetical protein [Sphingomonas sp.]